MLNGHGSSQEQLVPEQNFGRYTLLKKLATGGMAEVWLARQRGIERFEKKLVIKRILPKFAGDTEFREMFLNEARIAAQFSHPNIVQIYDMGEVGGSYYIAMEWVNGQDLGRIVRRVQALRQKFPPHIAIRIIALCCEALYYAHTRTDDEGRPLKVIHRDISPQNILVGFDGSVKLVDFGIAKAVDSAAMTKTGHIKGKLSYMAPEQPVSKTLDHRVDIFAIGLTLYELLSNTRPLKRHTDAATFMAALACKIPPLGKVVQAPADLDPIVMKAIAKDREARYPDARQFGMALERYLASQGQIAGVVQISEMMTALFADLPLGVPRKIGDAPRVQVDPSCAVTPRDPLIPPDLPPRKQTNPGLEPPKATPMPALPGHAPGAWAPGTPVGKGDRYLIRRKLGEGAMSEVYLCASIGVGPDRNVAIKRPRAGVVKDPQFAGGFIREASLAASLGHRTVVRILDFDQHAGMPFYVMEYVRGRSLRQVLERGRERRSPLSPRLVAWIGEQVAQGLGLAHHLSDRDGQPLGVLHLNLWPGNVLLAFDGAVKLTDVGTASRGKTAYSPPEHVRGEAVDARSDVFSLGVVLWEALTARRLFDADSEGEIRSAVESDDIIPPSLLNFHTVPEAMSDVVMRCLERDPERRFQSTDELCRALQVARGPESAEIDLARYLRELYGDEISRQVELDHVSVPLSLDPVSPEMDELSPISDPAVWVPIELSPEPPQEAETVVAGGDLVAAAKSARGHDGEP